MRNELINKANEFKEYSGTYFHMFADETDKKYDIDEYINSMITLQELQKFIQMY